MLSDELRKRFPGAVSYRPGDSEALNREILELMASGAKTVTCDAWRLFEDRGEPFPIEGRIDIAVDWAGKPAIATRTLKVERIRYADMTEEKASAQGEFRDLEDWQRGYAAYFARTAGGCTPDMELMVETFEVVAVLDTMLSDDNESGN